MLHILKKKKEEPTTFKNIENFETVSDEDLKEAADNCPSWAEVKGRLDSLMRFQQRLQPLAGQVPEDVMARRHNLEEKCQILRNRLNQIEAEQARQRQQAADNYAKEAWKTEQPNLRWSADPIIATIHRLGTAQVPLSSVKWQKCPTDGRISIHTASGRTVKVDLSRLPSAYWKTLSEQRFSPLMIGIENSGVVIDGKKQGIMLDSKFHPDKRIVTTPTFLAVMLV